MNNFLIKEFGKDRRWVNWKYQIVKDKKTKVPFSLNGKRASSTDPKSWATYEDVTKASDRIGLVFTPDEMLLGIDIDHCLDDKNTLPKDIAKFVKEANTYTELSPSKTGLHLFLKLSEPLTLLAHKKAPYEIYTSGRYFTVTGIPFGKAKPVRKITKAEATILLETIGYPWKEKEASNLAPDLSPSTFSDDIVLDKMFSSKNGKRIEALYKGDISGHDNDYSIAEIALCSHLSFWTARNAAQIERIWMNSPLGSRAKTQKRKDYRDRTISAAIKSTGTVYETPKGLIADPNTDDPIKIEEANIRKTFFKEKTKGTFMLADYLTRQFSIITVGEAEREMYVYQNGVYFRAENEIIYPEIQRVLGEMVTKAAKTETFHKIADMTSYPRSVFQSADLNFIPLKNGVYDTIKKELLPHDSKYRFTYQFPIIYDKNADCPKTKAFLNQVLTEDQIPTIQEWLGFYFYRIYAYKKAIIFVGEGDTGKTTLLETIINLLGKDNISGVSLQKMSGDKFAAAHLYERHGNLVDELSAKDISDTGNFKIATGGGSISGEYKFGNQFSFQNFSKFTFACNKIPDVKDFDDEAYFGRWMVIRFTKKIEKKIPNFISTLTTEEERSGLFNYAMEGLDRLLSEGSFSYSKSAMDTKLEMMRSGSSIAMFTAEKVIQENGAEISKDAMYEEYTRFCAQNGLGAETMKMFGSKFLFYVSYATEGLISGFSSGKQSQVRGWRNVKVLQEPIDPDNEKKVEEEFEKL